MKLVLLRCPNCAEPLKPDNDDVVLACKNCHTPVAIAVKGAVKMPVQFAIPPRHEPGSKRWMPFWVFTGKVNITVRETQGGRSQEKEAVSLWGVQRRFFVPAWELGSHVAQDIGSRLIERPPTYGKIDRPEEAHLQTAIISPSDAKKLIEFIVLAIEARRKDWLRDLEFNLEVGEPQMWAVPEDSFR
jgi:hypothetical protein